jgi:hypothetical protein
MAATESKDGEKRPEQALTAAEAIRAAARQLAELLGGEPDSVSALTAGDQGWTAHVEVVEIERIPDTASVMASYRVQLDAGGRLVGYERVRRYAKGQIDR